MRPRKATFLQQFFASDNKYVREIIATDPVQRAKLAVDQSSVGSLLPRKEPSEYKGSAILVIHHHAVMVCKACTGTLFIRTASALWYRPGIPAA